VVVALAVAEVVLAGTVSVTVVLESPELPQAGATSPTANNAAAIRYSLRFIFDIPHLSSCTDRRGHSPRGRAPSPPCSSARVDQRAHGDHHCDADDEQGDVIGQNRCSTRRLRHRVIRRSIRCLSGPDLDRQIRQSRGRRTRRRLSRRRFGDTRPPIISSSNAGVQSLQWSTAASDELESKSALCVSAR
jgi:hypothetical protein